MNRESQTSTFNFQHPRGMGVPARYHWMFEVGCSTRDVPDPANVSWALSRVISFPLHYAANHEALRP